MTPNNLDSRWLNYEAGALASRLAEARVMPFLIGLRDSDVIGPLGQLQLTTYDRDDVLKMMLDINKVASSPIEESRVRLTFDRFWVDLQNRLDPLVDQLLASGEDRRTREVDVGAVVEEILSVVRGQQQLLASQSATPHDQRSFTTRELLELWVTWDAIHELVLGNADAKRVDPELGRLSRSMDALVNDKVRDIPMQIDFSSGGGPQVIQYPDGVSALQVDQAIRFLRKGLLPGGNSLADWIVEQMQHREEREHILADDELPDEPQAEPIH